MYYTIYAIRSNYIKKEYLHIFKVLNIDWFLGCYLENEFRKYNDDYDQFLMNKADIKEIKEKYKNGKIVPVRVVYGEDDIKEGFLFYWDDKEIGSRGLISDFKDKRVVNLYKERSRII